MASYGGYSRTSYGAQGGEDGGGFFSGSQSGSQNAQGGKSGFADDSLRPVTVKQLLDVEEAYAGAELAVDGVPITQVTLVGQVRAVNPQSTNITYKIDDGTGVIDVKKWIDADKPEEAEAAYDIDQHVRVWGRVKSFNGRRHVGAHFLRKIDDFNEVNYHLLEATYVHLYMTRGPQGGGQQAGGAAGGGDSMFIDGPGGGGGGAGGNSKVAHCSANAQRMYNFLENSVGGNEGLHQDMISNGSGLSLQEVKAAAQELQGQGAVYNTYDDETWAILEF